jgi:flagellar biosynthetic protein FliR
MVLLNLFNLSLPQIQAIALVFIRIGAILVTAPLFGSMNVPVQLKVGLSVMLTVAVFPLVGFHGVPYASISSLASAMVGEVLIGVIIGFTARLLFAAVQLAGQMVGFQMGFGIVNVIDPQTSNQISIIAQFQNVIVLLLFVVLDVHWWFILSLTSSFELIPPLGFCFTNPLMEYLVVLSAQMFVIAAKVSAPIIVALLFTNVALGLIARTVPQMNIFIVGFPLQIAVGLAGLGLSLPLFSWVVRDLFQKMGEDIMVLMKLMT